MRPQSSCNCPKGLIVCVDGLIVFTDMYTQMCSVYVHVYLRHFGGQIHVFLIYQWAATFQHSTAKCRVFFLPLIHMPAYMYTHITMSSPYQDVSCCLLVGFASLFAIQNYCSNATRRVAKGTPLCFYNGSRKKCVCCRSCCDSGLSKDGMQKWLVLLE